MSVFEFLADPLWQPLSQALLHFLWQGVAVAVGVRALLLVWPVRQPRNRYLVYVAALLAAGACPIVTLWVSETPHPAPSVLTPEDGGGAPISTAGDTQVAGGDQEAHVDALDRSSIRGLSIAGDMARGEDVSGDDGSLGKAAWYTRIPEFADAMQPYCLLVWISGSLVLASRLAFSYLQVLWLALGAARAPSYLVNRANVFGKRLGLFLLPRIRVSEKVRDAVVMGLWRPVVLLPAAWLTKLHPEVLEAVLAHELAHVRRFDLWVNFLQRILETLLFYHPAVWWLSRQVSLEREMCTDELAVEATHNRLVYAEALQQLGYLRIADTKPQLTANMGGHKQLLLQRVSNILRPATPGGKACWLPGSLVAAVVPVAILLASIGVGAPSQNEPNSEGGVAETPQPFWVVTGTVTNDVGEPLSGVEVSASCGMGTLMPTGSVKTDPQGHYSLKFGPGVHTLDEASQTWKAGLQAATISARLAGHTERNLGRQGGLMMADALPSSDNSWGATEANTVLPGKPFPLDFVMVPAAVIEGEMVDERGAPLANTRVSLYGKEMRPSTSVLVGQTTDAQGRFRLEGIPTEYEWWFRVEGQGRTQPITLRQPTTYRIQLRGIHDARYDVRTIEIAGVSVPPDIDVLEQTVGDDPSARPPVSDELQAEGRAYLKRMALACRDWIAQSPPAAKEIKSLAYRFQLGDQPPEKIKVEDVQRSGLTLRRGIHYRGTPHALAAMADQVIFRQVEVDEETETIQLRFLVPGGQKVVAGNGITGQFLGFFSSPLREGLLILDKATCRPLKTDLETFSKYVDLGDGRYVPKEIRIRRGVGFWKWTFRVYRPGWWLLDEVYLGDSEQPSLKIDDVKIDGQPAVSAETQGDVVWGREFRGIRMRLRASKLRWKQGETPELVVDLHNTANERIDRLAFLRENWGIEMDGRLYLASAPDPNVGQDSPGFEIGTVLEGIPVPVHEGFVVAEEPLQWRPGIHTIRVHFTHNETMEDDGRYPEIHLVSNSVELEMIPAAPGVEVPPTRKDGVLQVVTQWLRLVEGNRSDAAASLMLRGKNENADDVLSMSVLLDEAAKGSVAPADVVTHSTRALVTTEALESGRYAGQVFIFHLKSDAKRADKWRIHEVSLLARNGLAAQLEAFNSPPVTQPVDRLGFGPTIERTLRSTESYTEALDLDTNRVIRVPHDLGINRQVTQDPIKWIAVRGADLGPRPSRSGGSELHGIFLQQVYRVGNEAWGEWNAAKVREGLPAVRSPVASSRLEGEESSRPLTYVFETSPEPTGVAQQGILQLLDAEPTTQAVKLRYKLIGEDTEPKHGVSAKRGTGTE